MLGNKRIDYDADNITIYNDKRVMLENNVIFKSSDFEIKSDNAVIIDSLNLFIAHSNVMLMRGNNIINGDSVYYYFKEETGIIYGGDSKIDKGYFYGNEIVSKNDDVFNIKNGYFTTCDSIKNPHYKIFGSRITYYENDRVYLYPAILYLRNVPVFALPFALIPAASTRKSGFLMPKVGYDALNGFFVRNMSYFWAVNNFSDMTFSGDAYQNGNMIVNYELRVLVKPYVNFNLYSTIAFENTRRWSIKGDYSHSLPYGIEMKSKWDYISDLDILTDYSDTNIVNLKRTTETFISLSKSFKRYSAYTSVNYRKDFADNSSIANLPVYRGYVSKIQLFKIKYILDNGLNYSHSHNFSNTTEMDSISQNYYSLLLNNSFDTYYTMLRFINIKPVSSINYTRNNARNISKAIASAGISATTQLYGTSKFGLSGFSKFRHTMIPSISYRKNSNIYMNYTDWETDSIIPSEYATFSLTNNYEGKYSEAIKVLLKNSNSITYDIKKDSFSVLSSNITILPSYFINSTVGIKYNFYSKDIVYNITSLMRNEISNPFAENKIHMTLSSSVNIQADSIIKNQLSASVGGRIGKSLNISYSMLYDFLDMKTVSSQLTINKDLHCWKGSFSISTYGDNFKYDFSLSLKEMPEISIDKNLLAPLFL